MVGVILVVVDKLVKRTPKSGTPFYTGMCVTKNDPCIVKTLRMVEPLQAIEQMLKVKEDQFVMLTNVMMNNDSVRSTGSTEVRFLNYVLSVKNFTV